MTKARDLANLGNKTSLDEINDAYDAGALSNRNLMINGSMAIDQRNGGSSVTPGNGVLTLDRWKSGLAQNSKFSVDQDSESPAGFTTSMKVTSLSAYTPSSNDHFFIEQEIEGYNAIPLALGSSDAKDISISFWVRSSLTGTFAGSVINSARNRSRVFEYTINTANTWEHKTVSFAGDTTGTWLTTNGKGITLRFSFGAAGTWLQNAGAWSTGNVTASSGSVNLVATNNATLYITGVQLEVGDTATPFEHRSYGDELAKCQRYFERMSFTSNQYTSIICYNEATNDARGSLQYQVTKRAAPTISATSNAFAAISTGGTGNAVSLSSDTQTLVTARIKLVNTNSTLVDGGASHVQAKADAQISIDAEL